MLLRKTTRILARMHRDKRAVAPVFLAVGRGLAAAARAVGRGASRAGRAVGRTVKRGAKKGKGAPPQPAAPARQAAPQAPATPAAPPQPAGYQRQPDLADIESKVMRDLGDQRPEPTKPPEVSPHPQVQQPEPVHPAPAAMPSTGNAGLGKKMMEGGGAVSSGGGQKPPIISVILTAAAFLVGLVTFQASGMLGVLNIMPLVLLVASVLILIFSKGKSIAGWILFLVFLGTIVYKFAGGEALPALLGLGMAAVGIVLLQVSRHTQSKLLAPAAYIFIVVAIYFVATNTAPFIAAAAQSGVFEKTAAESTAQAKESTSSLAKSFIQSYQRSIAQATGQRLEGDVDQTIKEEVGLEILLPYLPNPTSISEQEREITEINARVKGFDPKTPMNATTVCHLQTREAASKITTATGPNKNPGEPQNVNPKQVTGYSFDRDVTCYPKIPGCGNYVITLSSQADHLRTDAEARTNIIDNQILETSLRNYAESKSTELKSQAQINSAVNEIFKGQLYTHQSLSQKGAIKVILGLPKVPIIGVDDSTKFKMQIGIENMKKGWVLAVNKAEVTIPPYFVPDPEYCTQWEVKGSSDEGRQMLALKDSYLKAVDFTQIAQNQQKVFSSCLLRLKQQSAIDEPTLATFQIKTEYNYLVQQAYNLEVKDKDGKPCLKSAPVLSKTGTNGSTTGQGITTKPTAILSKMQGRADFEKAAEQCQGKAQGEGCGQGELCTQISGKMYCMPKCIHYATTEQAGTGLTKEYDCIVPATACKTDTAKTYDCKSSFVQGDFTCCIPNT
jgi:hypothetical protein